MEYTKGYWKVDGNKITCFGHGTIAICPSPSTEGTMEFIANAHLIAAAPQLYEALKEILKVAGWLDKLSDLPDNSPYKNAVAALQAAEGKTK